MCAVISAQAASEDNTRCTGRFSAARAPIGRSGAVPIRALLATLRADGTPQAAMAGLPTFDGFTDLIGLPEIRTLEGRRRDR